MLFDWKNEKYVFAKPGRSMCFTPISIYALESKNKNAKLFNCVQRGHQNSVEMMPIFFMLMILGGIRYPVACVDLGSLYT
ncbi:hypothetical protein VitviT2T_030641 [Vitis vinifera]|uniref:Uncharacterized protein n=2 Tax=Vitis vinifera TaxID=29760 RepID=A0ABY9E1Z6_VITVI